MVLEHKSRPVSKKQTLPESETKISDQNGPNPGGGGPNHDQTPGTKLP